MNSKLQRAEALAIEAHGDQRYGAAPYQTHLAAVVAVLERFGVSAATPEGEVLLCAGWLHDTLEDTGLDPERIAAIDPAVLDLVERVTDEAGATRSEKKARTYPKIAAAPPAVALKLADRIANVEACLGSQDERVRRKFERYREEHPGFRAALEPVRGPWLPELWAHLNRLLRVR